MCLFWQVKNNTHTHQKKKKKKKRLHHTRKSVNSDLDLAVAADLPVKSRGEQPALFLGSDGRILRSAETRSCRNLSFRAVQNLAASTVGKDTVITRAWDAHCCAPKWLQKLGVSLKRGSPWRNFIACCGTTSEQNFPMKSWRFQTDPSWIRIWSLCELSPNNRKSKGITSSGVLPFNFFADLTSRACFKFCFSTRSSFAFCSSNSLDNYNLKRKLF